MRVERLPARDTDSTWNVASILRTLASQIRPGEGRVWLERGESSGRAIRFAHVRMKHALLTLLPLEILSFGRRLRIIAEA